MSFFRSSGRLGLQRDEPRLYGMIHWERIAFKKRKHIVPTADILSPQGGFSGQVASHIKWRPAALKERQISIGGDGGGISIGGLTVGGSGGGNGQGNSTKGNGGGITLPDGVSLGGGKGGGNGQGANNQTQKGQSSALGAFIAAAEGASKNQTGAAAEAPAAAAAAATAPSGQGAVGEGQAVAGEPAAGEGVAAPGGEAAAPGEPKAVAESEQFSENAGITVGQDGQTQNLGGNLGITKGSDGSTSVGGKSGINISPAAPAPAAGQAAA